MVDNELMCRLHPTATVSALTLVAVLVACGGNTWDADGAPSDGDADTDVDADIDVDADVDADGDADGDGDDDGGPPVDAAEALVEGLDPHRYAAGIETLSGFGDRTHGSASYLEAETWAVAELEAAGYTVERHRFDTTRGERDSLFVTRVGTTSPDRMYIISAHLDGTGGGGGADDDGSGSSLVLEAARAFARADLELDVSVRFVLWNSEEAGLLGSAAYVRDRRALQGIEDPPGSGRYPEPTWLGVIQHDMILFDHGLPPAADQIPAADLDVEYQQRASSAEASRSLAETLVAGCTRFATDFPAEVGPDMSNTDSVPFQEHAPSVSIRENRRGDEIGHGANPHWHQTTDVYATYSEADLRLGFNAVQMTVGTVAELAGARIVP